MSDDLQQPVAVENALQAGPATVTPDLGLQSPASGLNIVSEELRSNPALKDFKSVDDLAKSYVHANSMIGSSIRIPSQEASAEAKAEFYKKLTSVPGVMQFDEENLDPVYNRLGRPESPDKYALQVPEGVDPNMYSSIKEVAHKAGLTNKQLQTIVEFDAARAAESNQQTYNIVADYQQKVKQEFGPDLNNRLAAANEAVKMYTAKYPDLADLLQNPVIANHPAFVSIFADIGKRAVEGKIPGVQSNMQFGMTAAEAQAQINEIRANRAHPLYNRNDPRHGDAAAKMEKLYQIVSHGETNQE